MDERLERCPQNRLREAIIELRDRLVTLRSDTAKSEMLKIFRACRNLGLGSKAVLQSLQNSYSSDAAVLEQ
jgi:hypothetical protein